MSSNRPYLLRAIYQWIIDNGLTPEVFVDAGYPGVQVPQEYVQQGRIVLNIAPGAVAGFLADNDGVSFSARFGGVPREIFLPVRSIQAILTRENRQGMVFSDEDEPDPEPSSRPGDKGSDANADRRSHLKVIK